MVLRDFDYFVFLLDLLGFLFYLCCVFVNFTVFFDF